MTKIRLFMSEPVIELDGSHYSVQSLPYDLSTLEVDECYIYDGLALIYRGEIKSEKEVNKPGLYTMKGVRVIHMPDDVREHYSSEHVREFNVSSIIDDILNNTDQFVNPEDLEVIQNNAELTIPIIKPSDDFLTRIVKQVIISKKINLKNYEQKIEKSLFTNMKLSLNTESRKMSVMYFKRWAEVLGFDFSIVVTDDGTDSLAPLKDDISYDSTEEGNEGED